MAEFESIGTHFQNAKTCSFEGHVQAQLAKGQGLTASAPEGRHARRWAANAPLRQYRLPGDASDFEAMRDVEVAYDQKKVVTGALEPKHGDLGFHAIVSVSIG